MPETYTLQLTRKELWLLRNAVRYRLKYASLYDLRPFWTQEADAFFDDFVKMVSRVSKEEPDASDW